MLNLEFGHGRSGVQPMVENLPKDRHGSGGFRGGFFRKMQKKNRRKNPPENPPAENKKSTGTRPPTKSASQAQQSAAKPTNKSACQTSKCTPVFRLRRIALGGVFRAWILGRSLAALWAWSRLPCSNALAIPQLLLVGWTRFAAHPSRQHF